jgi:hypothetical protein
VAGSKTYSISFRLRRTTYEDAFVSVPVTDEVMQDKTDEQGHRRLDADKLSRAALCLASNSKTRWRAEGDPILELHPIQVAPNEHPGDSSKIH